MEAATLNIPMPEAFEELFIPKRYKIYYGGRAGGKSENFARALLIKGYKQPLRILCTREIQKSIKDSVYRLLCDLIRLYELEPFYSITNDEIRGRNGTLFFFAGLKNTVIDNVKSYQGVDIVWCEEAHLITKRSWDILIPTIRKEDSEIWISFNPELHTDETYRRFILNPPHDAVVKKVGWQDNPWFNSVLEAERSHCKIADPENYAHIWEGACKTAVHGAIYAHELAKAETEGRITSVPYDRTKPVHTVWDLGWSDHTSIWFFQDFKFETRFIDFMQDRQRTIESYLQEIQKRGYTMGIYYLPHDAKNKLLSANGRSIEQLFREAGCKIKVLEKAPIVDTINATRTIFSNWWFDAGRCEEGINLLRRYRYEVNEDTRQFSRTPVHDDASHAGSALRMMALISVSRGTEAKARRYNNDGYHLGWDAV